MPDPTATGNFIPVIAIDGPGGSGKGTVALAVARRLDWHVLDSGALYRLVGLAAAKRGIPLDDETAVATLARDLNTSFEPDGRIILDGENATRAIRTDQAGAAASRVATLT